MNDKRIVIVGAGPGGLGAAMLLAARGFAVTILEKEPTVGGRSGSVVLGDYRFDIGSTLLMMRFLIEEIFEAAGTRLSSEVDVVSLDPMYRLVFGDRSLDVFADPARMQAALRRFAPGSESGLQHFLEREHRRLERLYPLLQRSWPGLASMIDPSVVAALPHVGIGRSLHQSSADYFTDPELQLGFSFQSAYLGMSPWACPSGFGMVPYVEHAWGVDYIRGGIHQLSVAMQRIAESRGATIRVNATVARVLVDGNSATGVELSTGERIDADEVVINADAASALCELLDRDVSFRFRKSTLRNLNESCSTFMMYLGIDTQLPIPHHTFFFADDYRGEMQHVFGDGRFNDDLSLYVCNASVTDDSVAPRGHSSLYALALVPNTRSTIDWQTETPAMRKRVLSVLERRVGVDVASHIQAERIITPTEWESRYHISHAAVFGPAHSIGQLLALRLPNQLPSPHNVYLTGGGTSPGSGIPTILESARIASRLICEKHRVPFPASKPLPEPATWCRGPRRRFAEALVV